MQVQLDSALQKYEGAQREVNLLKSQVQFSNELLDGILKNLLVEVKEIKDLVEKRPERTTETDPYVAKKSKVPRLQELQTNLVKGDPEIVPKGVNEDGEEELWYKFAEGKYLTADQLTAVEKATYITGRVELLCDFMFDKKAGDWTVDPQKSKKFNVITDDLIHIMITILLNMKWDYKTCCDYDVVRARIVKHTSNVRVAGKPSGQERPKTKALIDGGSASAKYKGSSSKDKTDEKLTAVNRKRSKKAHTKDNDECSKKRRKGSKKHFSKKVVNSSSEESSSSINDNDDCKRQTESRNGHTSRMSSGGKPQEKKAESDSADSGSDSCSDDEDLSSSHDGTNRKSDSPSSSPVRNKD